MVYFPELALEIIFFGTFNAFFGIDILFYFFM
jgi:hypothetical protein